MGVPIKSNNTQQGCNPISSNCVIWQGPDIPCIKMCTGDSVSDTIAKLATELCEITSELDISLLDLSCFNPLYPTPQSFKDVMQIILDKICALENGTVNNDKSNTSGCPQDCEVQIAGCLQYQDYLGNNVTTLPLKDYVILIGNKICTILSDITNLQNQIDNLDVRVEALENASSGSGSLFDVTSDCVTQGTVPLQEYITALDAAFCELLGNTGTEQDYTNAALASGCVTGSSVQMANPPALMGSYQNPPWLASPQNAMQQIQNLWVAVCDLRGGLTNLQAQLEECCAEPPACPNLPRCTLGLNKGQYDNFVYYEVVGATGVTPNGVTINNELWQLVSYTGTITPSSNPSNGFTGTILLPAENTSTINYGGTQNKLWDNPTVGNSLSVQVSGSFVWKNTVTDQECTVTISNNNSNVQPYIQLCPILPPNASSNFTITSSNAPAPCYIGSTATVTLSVNNFTPLTQAFQASMIVNYNINGGATQQLTYTQNNPNGVINNVPCGATINFTVASLTQGTYTYQNCGAQGTYTLAGTTPSTP